MDFLQREAISVQKNGRKRKRIIVVALMFFIVTSFLVSCSDQNNNETVGNSSTPAGTQTAPTTLMDILSKYEGDWIEAAYYESPITENAMIPFRINIKNGLLNKGYGHCEASIYDVPLILKEFSDGIAEIVCDISNRSQEEASYVDGDKLIVSLNDGETSVIKYYDHISGNEYTLVQYTGLKERYELDITSSEIKITWVHDAPEVNIYRSETKEERGTLICEVRKYPGIFIDKDIEEGKVYYYTFYHAAFDEEYKDPTTFDDGKWQITAEVK